jgi:addiction module HigA family antidote
MKPSTNRTPSFPGEILKELYMEPLGLTQGQLAQHLNCTRSAINEIINGRRGISVEMACRLGDAFGTSPELWLNLQRTYDLWLVRQTHVELPRLVS